MATITVNKKNEALVKDFLTKENVPFTFKKSTQTFSGKHDDNLTDFSIEKIEQDKLNELMKIVN